MATGTCDMCNQPTESFLCTECVEWQTYWAELSSEDKRREIAAMGFYADEADC